MHGPKWNSMSWRAAIVVSLSVILVAADTPPPSTNLPVQKIGTHDLISLSVYGAPELSRTIRVGAGGLIRLPMLRQPVKAEGLLPDELEDRIARALREEQILVDPVVTVNIVEYYSRPISVAGAVRKPVTFQSFGGTTLLDALNRAEGLSPESGPEILVTRRQAGADGQTLALVQRIPVKGLIDAADPELNLRLHGGEEIRVPEVGKVFVVGNVRKPGSYPVQDSSGTTVLKILALSEGLAPFASRQGFIYRREGGSGTKNEIPFELRKILDRKSPDLPLQPNDILYIPDNRTQRVGLSALERILSFGTATASGLLIYGSIR
jgi:polysaccharide export outer membrane protein